MIYVSRNLLMNHKPVCDAAVSPVVGIMLLLVVTLILAAIISGMTGGIAHYPAETLLSWFLRRQWYMILLQLVFLISG